MHPILEPKGSSGRDGVMGRPLLEDPFERFYVGSVRLYGSTEVINLLNRALILSMFYVIRTRSIIVGLL